MIAATVGDTRGDIAKAAIAGTGTKDTAATTEGMTVETTVDRTTGAVGATTTTTTRDGQTLAMRNS